MTPWLIGRRWPQGLVYAVLERSGERINESLGERVRLAKRTEAEQADQRAIYAASGVDEMDWLEQGRV